MKNVVFDPWVGKTYENGGCFCKKILLLGESHYGQNMGSSMTKDIIYDQTYSNYTRSIYTNFERALKGEETNPDDREKIWNSVAFYNYVQTCISKTRKSPSEEEFSDSEEAFFEVLDELEPDVVLVWGTRLWENLPNTNFEAYGDCEYKGYAYRCGSYTTNKGTKVVCYEMQHPSSGFSWSWWHNFLIQNDILRSPK